MKVVSVPLLLKDNVRSSDDTVEMYVFWDFVWITVAHLAMCKSAGCGR